MLNCNNFFLQSAREETETPTDLDTEKSKPPEDVQAIKAEDDVESPPRPGLPSLESGPWDDLKDEFQVCTSFFLSIST